jgi:outer membrane protein assembly factor BamD (BamD/ComL family)
MACESENQRDKAYNKINQMIKNDSMLQSNSRGLYMDSVIRECEAFIGKYPKDSMVEFLLLQTSNYQVTQQRYRLSLVQLDKLIRVYPSSKYIPTALFLKGEILNANLKDKEKAKQVWAELINRFPKNVWSEQASILLQNIDVESDEELFKRIVKDKGN